MRRFEQMRRFGQMRRFVMVAVVAALVLAPVALAAGGLSGKYKTTITGNPRLNGILTLDFAKGGSLTVTDNGRVLARPRFSTSGSQLTLYRDKGSGGCPGTGKYQWRLTGKTLRFTRIKDTCQARETVLAHTYTKIGG